MSNSGDVIVGISPDGDRIPVAVGSVGDVIVSLKVNEAELRPFFNPTYGTAMNQDGRFSGTPVLIHDGTDVIAWTATDITGTKMTADSTDRAFDGTKSVKVDNPTLGDVWQFDNGGNQDLTAYVALSMYVNVDSDWGAGDSVELYGWDGVAEVGTRVAIETYFAEGDFDVWQPVAIPLGDMGLIGATVTGFRMQQVGAVGKAATFYVDLFRIEESGAPIEFTATPTEAGARYHATSMLLTFVDAYDSRLADGTMPALSYDKILAVPTLPNGIVLSRIAGGVVSLQASFSSLLDFMAIGFELRSAISDGTNTAIVLEQKFADPLIMEGNVADNFIGITIQDDLSGLIRFTAFLQGFEDIEAT